MVRLRFRNTFSLQISQLVRFYALAGSHGGATNFRASFATVPAQTLLANSVKSASITKPGLFFKKNFWFGTWSWQIDEGSNFKASSLQ